MGGATKAIKNLSKKIKKVDPLRGGDALLEKAGLPTVTGEGDKSIFGADPTMPEAGQQLTPAGVPTIDDARAAADQSDLLRRRRGRAATILTGRSGDTSTVNVGTKTLLG